MCMGCWEGAYRVYVGCPGCYRVLEEMPRVPMGCLGGVYGVPVGCLGGVYGVPVGCLRDAQGAYGVYMGCLGCVWGAQGVCTGCLGGAQGTYRVLRGARRVSGVYVGHLGVDPGYIWGAWRGAGV